MAYSYKGSISFGLVYIPITLHQAIQENRISFNLLDKKTMSKIKYKKTCVDCKDKEVKNEDIVKGYEYEDDKYVIFNDNDFEKIKTKKDKNIIIDNFIELDEIDPIYFDKPYYVVPTGAQKAFYLLLNAMEEENKAGIAKTVLGTKETLVLIRSRNHEMLLNTLYFHNEIKKNPIDEIDVVISKSELELAKTLIQQMSAPFNPQNYQDEYTLKIQNAIESKIQGKEIVAVKEKSSKNVLDLMEALQSSLKHYKTPAKKTKKSTSPISNNKKQRPSAHA